MTTHPPYSAEAWGLLECTLNSLIYTWRKGKIFNCESLRILKESNISRMPCVATTDQPNGFDISAVFHLCPALPTLTVSVMSTKTLLCFPQFDSCPVPIGASFISGLELRECTRPARFVRSKGVVNSGLSTACAQGRVICVCIILPHLVFN